MEAGQITKQAPNFAQVLRDIRTVDAEEAEIAEIARRGSDRWLEVMADGLADQREDQRREDLFGSEE